MANPGKNLQRRKKKDIEDLESVIYKLENALAALVEEEKSVSEQQQIVRRKTESQGTLRRAVDAFLVEEEQEISVDIPKRSEEKPEEDSHQTGSEVDNINTAGKVEVEQPQPITQPQPCVESSKATDNENNNKEKESQQEKVESSEDEVEAVAPVVQDVLASIMPKLDIASLRERLFAHIPPHAQSLTGHKDEVNVLTVMPDGRLASGSDDATIRLWDLSKSKPSGTKLKAHTKSIWSLQVVMRKGEVCCASGDWGGDICLWDIRSRKCVQSWKAHRDAVFRLAVLADGRLLSASWDSTLKIWDPDTGRCLATLEGHKGYVRALAVLWDGRWASAGDDKRILIWDGEGAGSSSGSSSSPTLVKTLAGHKKKIECLTALFDGKLASAGHDATIRIWDVDEGLCLKVLSGHQRVVRCLCPLPEGCLVSGSKDRSLRVWHVESGEQVEVIVGAHEADVISLVRLKSGPLASCSWDKKVKIWDFPRISQ